MDFWSRLLSPLSSGTSRKDQAKDPAKRLHRFEKEYGNLLSTWRASGNLSRDSDAAENLEIRLQELTNILSDESRRPLPHPCIQYASLKQIYIPIGKIATTSYNEWIIKEAVLFFATLIESEEEAFVETPTFSASLTNLLVRITGVNSVRLGLDTESRVVELAFNITTKIRLDPEILPAWFKTQRAAGPHRDEKDRDSRDTFVGRTQRADFPLFYILMDYIHHEGKVGDFARTGLLYIIEAASSSGPLEQWIVESDLSTLMATGLGALYSQLSRKLVIDHLPHDLPPILAFSDYEHPASNYEVISSCSPEFQSHLETFLSHLLFWQDVLNHCRSVEVKSTLLEHFQVIFLQQLLYPSLLESSDIDGGSSVAVLTYLRRILESLDHPDMINLILHYLLALPDSLPSKRASSSSVSLARKRKSMDLATMLAEKSDTTITPLLFNLVDLILACLRSRNQQTIYVTLQLVSAILKRHHRYAIITLLRTDILPINNPRRTVGAHEQEVEYLMTLAGTIGGQDNFDEVYQSVLRDTMSRLESHPCSIKLVAPRVSAGNQRLPAVADSLPGAPREVGDHTLRPDDPLLNALLDLLETFFINPVETNLSVTETLVDLAICGYMKIEGWLARSPNAYRYEGDDEDEESEPTDDEATEVDAGELDMPLSAEQEQIKAMERCRQRPEWTQASVPRVLNVLKRLEEQVVSYKKTIPRFDDLVQQRREAFQTADAMLHSPAPPQKATPGQQETPDRRSLDEVSRSASPSRPSALEGLAHRLLSELGTPSRSSTPRGRKEQTRSSGSGSATPSSKAGLAPPKEIYSERGSSTSHRSKSRSRVREETASSHGAGSDPVVSQVAAFAAIDQTILSKRVGLPSPQIDPIPLNFDKKPVPEPTEIEAEEETAEGVDEPAKPDEQGEPIDQGEPAPTEPNSTEPTATEPIATESIATESIATESIATESIATEPVATDALQDKPDDPESKADVKEETKKKTDEKEPGTVSVSHIVTNVMILQSFLFELASLVQVRAGLFDEVRFV
ncbi:Retinoic acid induced 16-like protein-domain-containing protein [Dactylonectria estremocensis]|uniref:Retinoic acid induced 16-like protein-domain-containing protein n=1 Tax=Dactylonectria estremocensis TaxID=1079267 RepID=A0A9P9EQA5_9HYPO|nr:Retinoic acid induced 16-like protein-domain-containing protein [Dactylonectria estremocensis]